MACVYLEYLLTSITVGQIHEDGPVEAARPQQRPVEDARLVRRGQNDDSLFAREAIHFREDLVERLLLLARPADDGRTTSTPDRVQLVDEDDRRRILACLLEE